MEVRSLDFVPFVCLELPGSKTLTSWWVLIRFCPFSIKAWIIGLIFTCTQKHRSMRLAEYDPLISSVEPKTRSWVHVNEGRLYLAYRDWALRMGWILQALISILKAANTWNQIQVLRFKVHLHGKSGRIEPPVREPTDHHLDGTWNSACPTESWIIKEFAKEKVQAVNAQPVHGSWLGFLLAFRRTQWIRIHTLQAIMYLNCVRTTIMPGLAVVNKCPVKMLFFNLFKPAQSQSNPIPVAFHAFKQKQLSANDKALPEKWACSIQVKMIMVLVAKRPSPGPVVGPALRASIIGDLSFIFPLILLISKSWATHGSDLNSRTTISLAFLAWQIKKAWNQLKGQGVSKIADGTFHSHTPQHLEEPDGHSSVKSGLGNPWLPSWRGTQKKTASCCYL